MPNFTKNIKRMRQPIKSIPLTQHLSFSVFFLYMEWMTIYNLVWGFPVVSLSLSILYSIPREFVNMMCFDKMIKLQPLSQLIFITDILTQQTLTHNIIWIKCTQSSHQWKNRCRNRTNIGYFFQKMYEQNASS